MRSPNDRGQRAAMALGCAVWLVACAPGGTGSTSTGGGVCRSSGQSCATTDQCCSGFQCANGTCAFVGGNNGGNGGSGSSGSSSSSGSGNSSGTTSRGSTAQSGSSSSSGSSGSSSSSTSSGSASSSSSGSSSSGSSGSSSGSSSGTVFSTGSNGSGSSGTASSSGGSTASGSGSSSGSSSSSSTSSSSSSGGACATLVTGYGTVCTPGTATCTAPTQCLFDPIQNASLCLYTCNANADCPDIATHCVSHVCVDNPCGGVGDGGVSYPGTLNGPCNATATLDGTCAAEPTLGLASPGVCLQTGGTSTGACNAWTRCADRTQLCQTGWACYSSAAGPGGNCEELCPPSGVNSCPSPDICQVQSDGVTGACGPDGGSILGGDGGFTCDTTTCTGCPNGMTCMCIDLLGGTGSIACTVGNPSCTFLGTALPGICQ